MSTRQILWGSVVVIAVAYIVYNRPFTSTPDGAMASNMNDATTGTATGALNNQSGNYSSGVNP